MKASPAIKMPMTITDIAERPFDKIYLDIVGPLEPTHSGNIYILTFQDNLTKFFDCYAIPNAEALTVAQIFFDEIVTRYGIPKRVVTDQGTNFLSDLFKSLCKLLRVKKLQTTAYHPQSNGALERAHRPLVEYLRSITDENPKAWDQFLRTAAFVYNNSIHDGTKLTPMDCLYGFSPDVPTNLKRKPEPIYNHETYHHLLKYKLQKTYEIARRNLLQSKIRSKNYYDKNIRPHTFHIGDQVLIHVENKKGKLAPLWRGPYTVTAISSPVNSLVKIGKKYVNIHNNRLKPFHS